jgi:hypothetical protein
VQRFADRAGELLRREGSMAMSLLGKRLAELGNLRETLRRAGEQGTNPIVSLARLFPDVMVVRGFRVAAAASGSGS